MCISTHEKVLIKFWSILVMLYVKSRFFFYIALGVQLDNRVHPLGMKLNKDHVCSIYIVIAYKNLRIAIWNMLEHRREREREIFCIDKVHSSCSCKLFHLPCKSTPSHEYYLTIVPIPGNRNKCVARVVFYDCQTTSILFPNPSKQTIEMCYVNSGLVGILWFICGKHNN